MGRCVPGAGARPVVGPKTAPRAEAGARGEAGASSHHVAGGELVALAAELTGARPQAVAIGVGVADLGMGEGLSPAVEASAP